MYRIARMNTAATIKRFADVIDLWPSAAAYGADIGIEAGTARQMRNRDSIPSEHWKATVEAAALRGFAGVTLERLAVLAAERRQPARVAS